MKYPENHQINKSIIDLKYHSRNQAIQNNAWLEDTCEGDLFPALEATMQEVFPGEYFLALDHLVIDLGVITQQELRAGFSDRVKIELKKQLQKLRSNSFGENYLNIDDSLPIDSNIRLNAISYYLQHGYFPSWSVHPPSLQELLDHLLNNSPKHFAEMIKKLGSRSYEFRKRIALEFTSKQIDRLIRILEPSDANWILDIREGLSEKVIENEGGEKQVLKDKLLNILILNYLLVESGSRFNKVIFTESLLNRLAHHYNIELSRLVNTIYTIVHLTEFRSALFEEFKETIVIIKDHLESDDSLTEIPREKQKNRSILEEILEMMGGIQHATKLGWDLWSDRQKLTYLLHQHTKFVLNLTEKQILSLLQILEGGQSESYNSLASTVFSEAIARDNNNRIEKKEYLKLSLLNWLEVDNHSVFGSKGSWFAALILTVNQKFQTDSISIERFEQIGKSNGVPTAKYILLFLQNPKSKVFFESHKKSFQKSNPDVEEALLGFWALDVKKTILYYLTSGAISTSQEMVSFQDLQKALGHLVAEKDEFLLELITSQDSNLESNSRLIKLFGALPNPTIISYFKSVFPVLKEYIDFLVPILNDQTNTKKREHLLSSLFSQFQHLKTHGIGNDNELISSFLMLFFDSTQSAKRNGKDVIDLHRANSFSNLIVDNFNYLYIENEAQQYLRILMLSPILLQGQHRKHFSTLHSKGLLGNNSTFKLRTRDYQIYRSLKKIAKLKSFKEQESFAKAKDYLDSFLYYSIERDFQKLHKLSLKWDYSKGKQKEIEQTVIQIWGRYSSHNRIVEKYFESQATKIPSLIGVIYFHLPISQRVLAKKAFKKHIPEKLLDSWGSEFLTENSNTKSIDFTNLFDFGSIGINSTHVPQVALDQISRLYSEISQKYFSSDISWNQWRSAIKKATLYALFWKGDQDPKLFLKAWLSNFESILEPTILHLQQSLELVKNIRNSNYMSSYLKDGILEILHSKSTSQDVSSFQETVLWIETYLFLERNGYLPWWSPKKSRAEFLIEYLQKISIENESTRKLMLSNFSAKSFQGQIKVLSIQNRQKLGVVFTAIPFLIFSEKELGGIQESFKLDLSKKISNPPSQSLAPLGKKESVISKQILHLKSVGSDYSEVLRKLTFRFDEELLIEELFGNSSFKIQLKELLRMAPFFFVGNLNPGTWRWLVFSFGWNQLLKKASPSDNRFFQFFLNYLERNHHKYAWKAIFLKVYQVDAFQKSTKKEVKKAVEFYLEKELNVFREESSPVLGDRVLLANAGVILCWPFLSQLFSLLEFTKGNRFESDEKQQKAALLIQFIAFGDVHFPEYEMVLNKILTGIPLENHLDRTILLEEKEKEMALTLFHGIRNNWDKMKSASVQAIRETFLQRAGYLTFEPTWLKLEVEKKGVDVLLDSIPWGLSMVKLPWMTRSLEIIWR
ncbi:contractile injection system tape measure protein [Algoriphagus aquimarinus]|uniref:Uncharacterized protein n=1 Tax=Algoriphagus aquimarinus TaxID=237018 RepID=A0A1I1BSN0_9BACT|nr:contractile injection system tape measure protein [Algoriphagus aquimarinus]SFB53454.1 hypothetical protein SAMN04489723_11753 [Algoriphagus aquimarinus]